MNLYDLVKRICYDFFMITTGILFCHITFCIIFSPDSIFHVWELCQIPIAAAITSCLAIIFYSKKELTKKQWKIRSIVHLIALELVVLALAGPFKWVETDSFIQYFALFVMVLVVYAVVLILGWRSDRLLASQINQALKDIQE